MPGLDQAARRHGLPLLLRRALAPALAAVLSGGAQAPAHPGHAPPTVTISAFQFQPQTLNVVQGDVVYWNWTGPDTNHSVTSDSSSKEKFDSDAGKSTSQVKHSEGDSFPYFFRNPGTFTYHCKVHPYMTAKVVVARDPSLDVTPPTLSRLKATVAAHRLRATWRLSEKAGVTLQIRRRGRSKVLRDGFVFAGKGRGGKTVSVRGLASGRYVLSARAEDDTGNDSRVARTGFRL